MPSLSTVKQCLALFCENGVQYVWYENFIKKKTLIYWNIYETFITQKNEFMFKINLFISAAATFVHVSVVQPLLFKLYLIKL